MKVMFINTVYSRGSTGRIIKELGNAIESQGGEYFVAYGRGDKNDDKHAWRMESSIGNVFHAGMSRLTDRAGFYSKRATKRLINKIKEFNPDIIHLHNLHGYYLNVEILFTYLKQEYTGKVIWTLHDCWAFTGHCTHYSYAKCDKWQKKCCQCVEKKRYPASLVCDASEKNYLQKKELFSNVPNMRVVTVSKWLKKEVEKSFLSAYPITCIYNGIDHDKFKPLESDIKEKLGIQDKKMILLVSDGWDERKGYSKFLEVTKVAPADWIFAIVGINGKEKLPSNVIGFEHIWNQEELIELYSAADVFFNPSVEETFGLVTVEAMACGTPVVVMNATASPELVGDEDCGVICESYDSSQTIIDKLKNAMEMKHARNVAVQFTIDIHNKSYVHLYAKEK